MNELEPRATRVALFRRRRATAPPDDVPPRFRQQHGDEDQVQKGERPFASERLVIRQSEHDLRKTRNPSDDKDRREIPVGVTLLVPALGRVFGSPPDPTNHGSEKCGPSGVKKA
jgi:hypothetical protein